MATFFGACLGASPDGRLALVREHVPGGTLEVRVRGDVAEGRGRVVWGGGGDCVGACRMGGAWASAVTPSGGLQVLFETGEGARGKNTTITLYFATIILKSRKESHRII